MHDYMINFVDEHRAPVTVSELSTEDLHRMLACPDGITPRDSDLQGTTVKDVLKRLRIELLIRQMGWR